MSITAYQRNVLDVLPGQVHRALRQALRDHGHRNRSKAYAKRAEASRRSARDAVKEYRALCDIYSDSIERSLAERGISGAYPDPELAWAELREGAQHSFIHGMDKRDEREHAVSLALRLLSAGDQGDAR